MKTNKSNRGKFPVGVQLPPEPPRVYYNSMGLDDVSCSFFTRILEEKRERERIEYENLHYQRV